MASERRPVQFFELLRSLVAGEVDFIVVGGVAAVLEGAPVSTFDLDIVYSKDEKNIDRLACVLEDLDSVYVEPSGRRIQPTAERLRGGGHHLLRTIHGRLDVMGAIGNELTYADLLPRSPRRTLRGLEIAVLDLETLIATKEAADRPKDRAVLDLLRLALDERRRNRGE